VKADGQLFEETGELPIRYFATAFTLRKSMRAIELYSKPVNLGFSMVLSAFQ
jgi:hypothetical protein